MRENLLGDDDDYHDPHVHAMSRQLTTNDLEEKCARQDLTSHCRTSFALDQKCGCEVEYERVRKLREEEEKERERVRKIAVESNKKKKKKDNLERGKKE